MIDLDAIADSLDSMPTVLGHLLAPIDPAALAVRPEPGEWSVLEVIGHLVATDTGAFRDRISAIVEGEPEIAGFDPWAAINARDFNAVPLTDLLPEFTAERARSVAFVRWLADSDLSKTAGYGDRGVFAAGDFVYEWPFHDHEHLQQILDILKQRYLPLMTETMRVALVGQ